MQLHMEIPVMREDWLMTHFKVNHAYALFVELLTETIEQKQRLYLIIPCGQL